MIKGFASAGMIVAGLLSLTPACKSNAAEANCLVADPTDTPLNVRTSPYGKVLGIVSNGARVSIIDQTVDSHDKPWVYIADPAGNPIGWVYRNYITCK